MATFTDIDNGIKMAYFLLLVERVRKREQVFCERTQPLDLYDDIDMFKKYRFTRAGVISLMERLGGQLDHPTRRNHAVPLSFQSPSVTISTMRNEKDNEVCHRGPVCHEKQGKLNNKKVLQPVNQ